jgi:epsilon-lactone hydrolase
MDHREARGSMSRRRLAASGLALGMGAAGLRPDTLRAEEATPAASGEGWEVPARWLPPPVTVSDELQGLISTPPGDIWLRNLSADDFRAVQQAEAEIAPARAQALWDDLGLTVEQTEIAGVPCYRITPPEVSGANANRLLVHTHGGAYVLNGGPNASAEGSWIAASCGIPVVSIDYRMPPDHPYPAALDDAVAVWTEVMKDRETATTGLFGTSAGGGLAMATVLKAKELGLKMPGALSLNTPWTDLSKTGDSYVTMAMVDNAIVTWDGALGAAALLYAGGEDLSNPFISPVYGDVSGFPPTILFSGTRDLFVSNTVRAHRKLRQAGIEADLHVFEGLPHAGWSPWANLDQMSPESGDFLREMCAFFDRHLAG